MLRGTEARGPGGMRPHAGDRTGGETASGTFNLTGPEISTKMPGSLEGVIRILIVDDDANLLDMLMEGLRRNRAYTVEGARDGHDGLAKVGTFVPHLLILDLQLPGLDGLQVCRKVKADPATRSVKILAITARPEWALHDQALEAGADGFLAKPFRLAELQAEVTRLLGGAGS